MLFERADRLRNTPPSVRDARGGSRRLGANALKRWLGSPEVDDQKPRPSGDPERKSDERGVASAVYGLVVCLQPLRPPHSAAGFRSFVAVSVLVTVVMYWMAQSCAHALGRHAARRCPGLVGPGRSGAKGGQWSAPLHTLGHAVYSWVLWVLRSLSLSVSPWPLRPCCWGGLDGRPRAPAGCTAGAGRLPLGGAAAVLRHATLPSIERASSRIHLNCQLRMSS